MPTPRADLRPALTSLRHFCALLCVCLWAGSGLHGGEAATPPTPLTPAAPGWSAYLDGRVPAAAETFRQAAAERPDDPFPRFGLETIAAGEGRPREAFAHAVAALARSAGTPWLEIVLADALELAAYAEDPAPLHATLATLEAAARLSPLQRLLLRHARARAHWQSGQTAAGREALAELPFLREWLVLGPFSNREKSGFEIDHGPEADLPALDAEAAYGGRTGPVQWRRLATLPASGDLDLNALLYPHDESVAYAATHLQSARSAKALLVFGNSGAAAIWWNGTPLLQEETYHTYHPFQRVLPVELRAGTNQLVVKIAGERGGDCRFSALLLPGPLAAAESPVGAADGALPQLPGVELRPGAGFADGAVTVGADAAPAPGGDEAGLDWGGLGRFREAAAADSPPPLALVSLGYLYWTRGLEERQARRVRRLFEAAAAAAPRAPLCLEMAALVQPDAHRAESYLQRALERHPEETAAQELLLRRLHGGGLVRRAAALAREILDAGPSAEAAGVLAAILADRGWLPEAQAHLRRAVAAKPGDPDLRGRLADLAGAEPQRLAALRDGAARTGDPALRARWVRSVLSRPRTSAAELAAAAAENLVRRPWAADEYRLLADVHRRAGDLAAAGRALGRGLERLPDHPGLLEARGRLLLAQGQEEAAIEHWQVALSVAPDNPPLRDALAELVPQAERFFAPYDVPLETILADRPAPEDYPRYNSAVLLDQGVVRVNPNGTADHFIHFCRVALTERGAEELSRYAFGYDPARTRVEILAARVIQPDGSVLAAGDISDESGQRGGEGGIYSRFHSKSITLPQVRVGSVVQIKYLTEATGENLYGDDFEDAFYLGSRNPTRRFQYVLDTPAELPVTVRTHRREEAGVRFREENGPQRRVRVWEGEDLPGVELEPGMPPWSEVAPSLRASSFESWEEVGAWYWNLSREAIDLPADIAAEVRALVADARTDREKLERIYYEVIERVRYVGIELGRSGYVPHRAERTWRKAYGDCKDTAVLFCAMLEAVGLEGRVALVRTWDRGKEPTGTPGARRFNHAIAWVPDVDGRDWWLDGTSDYNRFEELPLMDQGAAALITGPGGGRYVTIPEDPAAANAEVIRSAVRVAADGSARAEMRFGYTGAYAPGNRATLEAPARLRLGLEQFLARRFAGAEVTAFEHSGSDLESAEAWFRVGASLPGLATQAGRRWRLKLVALPQRLAARYARQSERRHDLILGLPRLRRLEIEVTLPAGAEVLSAPDALEKTAPFGTFRRSIAVQGNRLEVTMETSLTARRLPREEYQAFRAWCAAVDAAEEEGLVYRVPAGAEPATLLAPAAADDGAGAEDAEDADDW